MVVGLCELNEMSQSHVFVCSHSALAVCLVEMKMSRAEAARLAIASQVWLLAAAATAQAEVETGGQRVQPHLPVPNDKLVEAAERQRQVGVNLVLKLALLIENISSIVFVIRDDLARLASNSRRVHFTSSRQECPAALSSL